MITDGIGKLSPMFVPKMLLSRFLEEGNISNECQTGIGSNSFEIVAVGVTQINVQFVLSTPRSKQLIYANILRNLE